MLEPGGRAAIGFLAALPEGRDPLFHQRKNFSRRGIGRAGVKRRRRIVFEPELNRLGGLTVEHDRDQRQCEIDSGGDTAA